MSEIEWTPAKWDQVKPGDKVKLVHDDGEQAIIGTASDGYTSFMPLINNLGGEVSGVICLYAKDAMWSLFIPRPAKPALPTEPFTTIRAIYLPAGNANTKVTHLTLLPRSEGNPESRWSYSNGISVDDADLPRIKSFEVVTAPVAETAKKVLEAMRIVAEERAGNPWNAGVTIAAVAREFGVTGGLGE